MSTVAVSEPSASRSPLDMWCDLTDLSNSLFAETARGRTATGVRPIAHGAGDVAAAVMALLRRVRHSLLVLQPETPFDPADRCGPVVRAHRARGVRMSVITSPRAGFDNPFVHTRRNLALAGPAIGSLLILDRASVVMPGPPTPSGAPTAYLASRPEVTRLALDVWATVERQSVSGDAVGWPQATQRQRRIASSVVLGEKDSSITRILGISARTLTAEVAALLRLTGTSSRCELGFHLGRLTNFSGVAISPP
ncbi:hypothetical protein [Luteipulveratus mongoliensis]|uniref:HTH luxR-type domain-containing protein n=1 Tax=Luteipulveratus mongoliensis TaxID=571913 RepID=A0A0K1JNK4_9MICO|nr:hypothetical protein [Luteipulveratus mongoliensis]AKU18281.1 hypothetical protein VV02_24615 [Luteipulveratus mongoliensis]